MPQIRDFLTSGIVLIDNDLNILQWNKWLTIHTEYEEQDVTGKKLSELFPEINEKALKRRVMLALLLETHAFYAPPSGYLIRIPNRKITNPIFEYMQQSIKVLPYERENNTVLLVINDQTEMREAYVKLERLKDQASRYMEVMDQHVLSLMVDDHGLILSASRPFLDMTGYRLDEIVGKTPQLFKSAKVDDDFYSAIWHEISSGNTWQGEFQICSRQGQEIWVKCSVFELWETPRNKRFQAIIEDVTDKKRIEKLSITDDLTHLFNRRHFNEVFQTEINRAKHQGGMFSFMLMDIDHFKRYNDTYGHQAGDKALQEMGKILRSYFRRAGDYTFRLGGEEFGGIFHTKTYDDSVKMCEGLRQEIRSLGIPHVNNTASDVLTASIGLYTVDFDRNPHLDLIIENVYNQCDELLYRAKELGRNRVECIKI